MPIELAEEGARTLREKLADFAHRPRHWRVPDIHTLCHKGEHFVHLTYLGLVYYESHAWYGKAAGVLFCITVVSFFIGEGEGEIA